MTHIHFRCSNIDKSEIDRRAAERGCENRSEYIRQLLREDIKEGQDA